MYNTKQIIYVYACVCLHICHTFFKCKEKFFLLNSRCKVFCFCVVLRSDDDSRTEPEPVAKRLNTELMLCVNWVVTFSITSTLITACGVPYSDSDKNTTLIRQDDHNRKLQFLFSSFCFLLPRTSCFSSYFFLSGIYNHYEFEPPHSRGSEIKHKGSPQSVGLLWTSDQPVADTSTWQTHNTHNRQTFFYLFSGKKTNTYRHITQASRKQCSKQGDMIRALHSCTIIVLSLYFVCTALSWSSWLCLLSLLYNTHNTNIHAPGGIRTRNPSKRSAADTRLTPFGHWDRRFSSLEVILNLLLLDSKEENIFKYEHYSV